MAKKIEINNETNELNYLFGGYFSGRGIISIVRHNPKAKRGSYWIMIYISFEDKSAAKLFQENFGGSIRERKYPKHWKSPKTKKNRKMSVWCVAHCEAMDFLCAIEPYILNKRMEKRIILAKKFYNYQQKNSWGKTDRIRKQKHKYYLSMRSLHSTNINS